MQLFSALNLDFCVLSGKNKLWTQVPIIKEHWPGLSACVCALHLHNWRTIYSKTLQPNKENALGRFSFVFFSSGELSPLRFIGLIFFQLGPNSLFLKSIGVVQQLLVQPYLNMDPINWMLCQPASFHDSPHSLRPLLKHLQISHGTRSCLSEFPHHLSVTRHPNRPTALYCGSAQQDRRQESCC